MPRGECSALPRTVDTGVARYEAFVSHNVRRAVCLSVLEQCSKLLAEELTLRQMARGIGSEQPRTVDTGCSLQMPRGECSALPRTVDTGVARYEAFASLNVRRAVCLSVLEQCSKVPRSELYVKWIPALSASYKTQFCTAKQTNLHNETVIMDNH
ncbi:hypothetical protein J6590_053775 [Homalodisca vitripennis]|nr:hypothetical protein J6590_053775 [Homalodisca vitripennis]